jgi:diguanylate cyclase (GGDEF)-like protein
MGEIRRASAWEIRLSHSFGVLRLQSLRERIIAFAMLAALVPSLITAYLAYGQSRRSLDARLGDELRTASTQAQREITLWHQQRVFDLRVFASSYEISENLHKSDARERIRAYLSSVMGRVEQNSELLVTDVDGSILASTADSAGSVDLPNDWLADIRAGRDVVGTPEQTASGGTTMLLAVPVNPTGGGSAVGALVARVRFDALSATLASTAPAAGMVSVLRPDGALILRVRPDGSAAPNGADLDPHQLEALRRDTTITSFRNSQGARALGAARTVDRLQWIVVAEVSQERAFAQVRRLRNTTLLIVVAILLGVGWIGYRLALLIVRPLDRLAVGAEQVASGDLTVDLPVIGAGEVAYLTTVFNDMVKRLREGREQLNAANDTLRSANQELERLSVTDQLTGLYNRRRLSEVLANEVLRSRRHQHAFSLLVMDVDNFKKFNDAHGHLAGDRVLASVADVLRETTREIDTPARYGGEEFVVVLPETDMEAAVEVAERIRLLLASRIFEGGRVTISIGVAEFPEHGSDPEALIAAADAALYRAKDEGRNRVMRAGTAA